MATSVPSTTSKAELKKLAVDEFQEQLAQYLKQYEAELKDWLASGGREEQGWITDAWEESKHPRNPKGSSKGGQFTQKPVEQLAVPYEYEDSPFSTERAVTVAEETFNNWSSVRPIGDIDSNYNCAAWACGSSDRFWWPRWGAMDKFDALFGWELQGETTENEKYEPGFVKVALYGRVMSGYLRPAHLARQLPSGDWVSKAGGSYVYLHGLRDVEGDLYGELLRVYKIPERQWVRAKKLIRRKEWQ